MTECRRCERKCDLFICPTCIENLRGQLRDLPWWLDRLIETAVGHAKLGDGGRRGTTGARLKGDDEVLPKCTCGHPEHQHRDECGAAIPGMVTVVELLEPDEDGNTSREIRGPERSCGCREYVPAMGQARIRAQFLAAGRVNARASDLLAEVQNTLTTWVRHLCEQRGLPLTAVRAVAPSFIGPLPNGSVRCAYTSAAGLAAVWLTEYVGAIAADEGAGQLFGELHRYVGDDKRDGEIGKLVNRPVPMRFLGKCPTWDERRQTICGTELRCPQDVVEVYCRKCRQTHNPDRLQLLLMNDLEHKNLTFEKILKANRMQPEEYQIPERTLRHWRQHDKLKIYGYKRPDGREAPSRHSDGDEPLYRWPDVRRLRAERPAKAG